MPTGDRNEGQQLDVVKDKLAARFEQDQGLPEGSADKAVDEAASRFEDAPRRDFVPLLTEKHARDSLIDAANDSPSEGTGHTEPDLH